MPIHARQWLMFTTALLLLAVIGCGKKGVIQSQQDSISSYPRVTLNSLSLADAVAMNDAQVNTAKGTDLLKVTQPIRARSDEPLYVEYRFVWLDKQGHPIEPQMSWHYKRLEPRIPDTITATATSESAVDYRVHVRWARR